MNFNKMNRQDLEAVQRQINDQIEKIKDKELNKRRENAKDQMVKLRQYKDFILSEILPKHDRSSCNDDNVCNGLDTADYGYRCTRCTLLELLEDEWRDGDYEVSFNVTIEKIQ